MYEVNDWVNWLGGDKSAHLANLAHRLITPLERLLYHVWRWIHDLQMATLPGGGK